MTRPIEWHDIQGNILNGYGYDYAAYLFMHADTGDAARGFLSQVVDRVTTATPWLPGGQPDTTLNVAITFSGFERLGVPPAVLRRFPEAFRQPTRERAELLGDTGPSHPDSWVPGLGTGEVHLMLTLNARSRDRLEEARADLHWLVEAESALGVVYEQDAHTMPGKREHFGYADGFAQPDIEGVQPLTSSRTASVRGNGVPMENFGWRPLKLGEFLLGYEDEDGKVDTEPDPVLAENGSYVVFRKLYQDVARFRLALHEAAVRCNLPDEVVAAKIVGRWRDGVPLELAPDRDLEEDLTDVAADEPSNDFRYLPHDRDGYVCPRGAHIRRVNPRDAFGFTHKLAARHRIIRRGLPYGPPLEVGAEEDGQDRGLVFVCYNANLERQFETVQRQWCNDGDAFGLGEDRDFILGNTGGTGKMTIPVRGTAPMFITTQPEIVLTRGAEYFFTPGIRALCRLTGSSPS